MHKMPGSKTGDIPGGILEFPLPADATPPPESLTAMKMNKKPVKRSEIHLRHRASEETPSAEHPPQQMH